MRSCALLLILSAALLTGCGSSDDNPVSKAFGSISENDSRTLRTFSKRVDRASKSYSAALSADGEGKVSLERTNVNAMSRALASADDAALDIDNDKLRATLQDYTGKFQRVASALDAYVALLEDPSMAPDPTTLNETVSEFRDAALAAREADRRFLNTLLEVSSPEQRDQLRSRYRQAQAALDAQIDTGR